MTADRDAAATIQTLADSLFRSDHQAWTTLFAPDAKIVADDERLTPDELWARLRSSNFETIYWPLMSAVRDGWAVLGRTITVLDDAGGTIWRGVDTYEFDQNGRIATMVMVDQQMIGLIT